MTDRIQEIRERLAKATPGPWRRPIDRDYECVVSDGKPYPNGYPSFVADTEWRADTELIAHAPSDLQFLLNEIERLQADSHVQRVVEERRTTLELQAQVDRMRKALIGLMDAHREGFSSSIYLAFRAGKTSFQSAWKAAEEALITKSPESGINEEAK